MRRRSSRRRRPMGEGRRRGLPHYGIILTICLVGALVLFLIFIFFRELATTQLPKGLR